MAAILGLVSALIWGGSDFFGGLAARRVGALLVTFLATVSGLVLAAVIALVTAPTYSLGALIAGALAGILGGIGQWAFFACLAIGPMSVLSPGVSAIYAVVPAIVGIALGEKFPPVGYVALVAVVIAAVLLAGTREGSGTRIRPKALLLALVAGLGFAGYIVALGVAPAGSGVLPVVADLAAGAVLFGIALLVDGLRTRGRSFAGFRDATAVRSALLAGALLGIAASLLAVALQLGDLAVVGVLNALYPIGTVTLAMIVLHERLTRLQVVGIALALAASAVLTLVSGG